MKRSKTGKPASAGTLQARTGRHGAVDYANNLAEPASIVSADHHVYRVIELVGTSEESIEDAVHSAIGRADKTLRNLRWFEIVRTSGHIDRGEVRHFQVTLKVGFTMEDRV